MLVQRFKGLFAQDSPKLFSIVADEAGALDHHVVHPPVAVVVGHLIINRDQGLAGVNLGLDLGRLPVRDLLEVVDFFAGVLLDAS
jgi:hypothetical protein